MTRIVLVLLTCIALLAVSCQRPEAKWLRKGKALGEAKDYEGALHSFEMAIQSNPNSSRGWQGKGYALELMGRDDEAMQAFDSALSIDGTYYQTWVSKGKLYRKMDLPQDALMCFTRALSLEPNLDQAHYEKGLALADVGRYDEAVRELNAALELNPGFDPEHADAKLRSKMALIYYGRARTYLSNGDTTRFLADVKTAVALDSTYAAKAAGDSTMKGLKEQAEFQRILHPGP